MSFVEGTDMLGLGSIPSSIPPASSTSVDGASSLPTPPRLSSDFVWVSANGLDSGGIGVGPLTQKEYLAAFGGRYNVRGIFPDWDWEAYDYRVVVDREDDANDDDDGDDDEDDGGAAMGTSSGSARGGTPIERLAAAEAGGKKAEEKGGGRDDDKTEKLREVTVRFTTRATGTFDGERPFPLSKRDRMGRAMLLPDGGRAVFPPTW
jgi:hypothetical protein